MSRRTTRRARRLLVAICAVGGLAACGSAGSSTPSSTTPAVATPSAAARLSIAPAPRSTTHPKSASRSAPKKVSPRTSSRSPSGTPSRSPTTTPSHHSTTTPRSSRPAATSSAPVRTVPAGTGPVIVLDPGHSPTINAVDPATGLNVSDYENEPEMRDVFAVAEIVRARLAALGYRVVMTKTSATQRITLAQRAAVANSVHASLALSIHDQAGASGGIAFDRGNNIVYYQSVGTYRSTSAGKRYYFTDGGLAATSERYGEIFRDEREHIEDHSVSLLSNTGYNLGSRGLAGGDIWMVQLLSHVPWIYNEAGGNSAGRSGLDSNDEHTYANALVASVERCVPV